MAFTRRVLKLFDDGDTEEHYECASCGREFELNRQVCPHCGSYRIERSSYDDLVSD